jgi:hypothetical protein
VVVHVIDGQRRERPVTLVHGFSADQSEAMILGRDGVSPF